jgi:hypothetical protein
LWTPCRSRRRLANSNGPPCRTASSSSVITRTHTRPTTADTCLGGRRQVEHGRCACPPAPVQTTAPFPGPRRRARRQLRSPVCPSIFHSTAQAAEVLGCSVNGRGQPGSDVRRHRPRGARGPAAGTGRPVRAGRGSGCDRAAGGGRLDPGPLLRRGTVTGGGPGLMVAACGDAAREGPAGPGAGPAGGVGLAALPGAGESGTILLTTNGRQYTIPGRRRRDRAVALSGRGAGSCSTSTAGCWPRTCATAAAGR